MKNTHTDYTSHEVTRLKQLITHTLDDSKAEDIVTIDLAGKSSIADYMIVASGRSSRHVGSIAENVLQAIRESGFPTGSIEGTGSDSNWVLVDALDVVIHIFQPEVRRLYNLEKMWAMALPEPVSC